MSWIKENKFAAMLGGGTLLVALVLLYVGLSYRGHYATALENYRNDADEVIGFEEIPLYPSLASRAGKTKALNEYRTSIAGLQAAFDKFRPKELKNITPQGFTDHAKTAREEVAKAFEEAGTKLPDAFFLGFEAYTTSLAREDATGLLDYQLGATKELMLTLAKAAPSQLQNLYRPKFPEEDGDKWEPGPTDATRSLPLEITFKGNERSLREFLTNIVKSPNYFFVVRSLRIMNEKQTAPRTADAKFETAPAAAGGAAKVPANPFGGIEDFVIPEEQPTPPPATPAPGTKPTPAPAPGTKPAPAPAPGTRPTPAPAPGTRPAPAPTAVPPPAPAIKPAATPGQVDSSRILNRVLGSEELQVFLYIDVLEFLPVKDLPEVPKSQP